MKRSIGGVVGTNAIFSNSLALDTAVYANPVENSLSPEQDRKGKISFFMPNRLLDVENKITY